MIPAPPAIFGAELPATAHDDIVAALVPGILSGCCACPRSTVWHWLDGARYIALHPTCISRVLEAWREALALGEGAAPPTGQLTGAYARRAQRLGVVTVHRQGVSVNLGSPFFIPGMPKGAPWTAVAIATDGVTVICPCGLNEVHARAVNRHRHGLARHGERTNGALTPARVLISGHVVDPTGAVSEAWKVD